MQKILDAAKTIDGLLQDAERDAQKALNYRESDPDLAHMYLDHSKDAMKAIQEKHSDVKKWIKDVEVQGQKPPAGMMEMYQYIHDRHIVTAEKIAELQKRYDA